MFDPDPASERLRECPSCGALCIEPAVFGPCDTCRSAERVAVNACEQLPMFTPAPAPMPGQLEL